MALTGSDPLSLQALFLEQEAEIQAAIDCDDYPVELSEPNREIAPRLDNDLNPIPPIDPIPPPAPGVGRCPPDRSNKLINSPELNCWIRRCLKSSPIQEKFLKIPVQVLESLWKCPSSMLDLLFNYSFDYENYSIFFKLTDIEKSPDCVLETRLNFCPGMINTYVCDSTAFLPIELVQDSTAELSVEVIPDHLSGCFGQFESVNLFNITWEEKAVLDKLFGYKMGIDIDLDDINFSSLTSCLSKLVYAYLEFELNNNATLYAGDEPFSGEGLEDDECGRLLCWAFEKWLIDHFYRAFSMSNAYLPTNCEGFGTLDTTSAITIVTDAEVDTKTLDFPDDTAPADIDHIFIVHNGMELIQKEDYDYIKPTLIWVGLGLEEKLNVGDKLYMLWAHEMIEI